LWTSYYVIAWGSVALLLLAGPRLWPGPGNPGAATNNQTASDGPRVLIFGDSISVVAAPDVNAALGTRYALTTQASARSTTQGSDKALAAAIARTNPQAVIVELGSDAALYGAETWRQDLDGILQTVASISCVAFVTVSPVEDYYYVVTTRKPPLNIAPQWNAKLEAVARLNPNFHLVDWGSASGDLPSSSDLVYDGTHPNEKGRAWLIAEYSRVLDEECFPGGVR
jgi:hypothetical protein